jgi:hypothetical protein
MWLITLLFEHQLGSLDLEVVQCVLESAVVDSSFLLGSARVRVGVCRAATPVLVVATRAKRRSKSITVIETRAI